MTDDKFEHYLKLSVIFLPILQDRMIFDDADETSEHNTLNGLQIIAETFVEMQRRLNVKPVFKISAGAA